MDWIYYKTNIDRIWKGPVKVTSKEGKRIYVLSAGQLVTINADDVLLHKPSENEEVYGEEFVSLPPPLLPKSSTAIESDDKEVHEIHNVQNRPHVEKIIKSIELGIPVSCKICNEEMSSKIVVEHALSKHGIKSGTIRTTSNSIPSKPNSTFMHAHKLKSGSVVSNSRQYFILQDRVNDRLWKALEVKSNTLLDLDIVRDLATMIFLGDYISHSDTSVLVNIDEEGNMQQSYSLNADASYPDTSKHANPEEGPGAKVFFTAVQEYTSDQTFVVTIPKHKHKEPECVEAKMKELSNFDIYDVYELVDKPKDANIRACPFYLSSSEKLLPHLSFKSSMGCWVPLDPSVHLVSELPRTS